MFLAERFINVAFLDASIGFVVVKLGYEAASPRMAC